MKNKVFGFVAAVFWVFQKTFGQDSLVHDTLKKFHVIPNYHFKKEDYNWWYWTKYFFNDMWQNHKAVVIIFGLFCISGIYKLAKKIFS